MTTQEEKSIGGFVKGSSSIAVSQDQRAHSDIGRLGKTIFCHLAGK